MHPKYQNRVRAAGSSASAHEACAKPGPPTDSTSDVTLSEPEINASSHVQVEETSHQPSGSHLEQDSNGLVVPCHQPTIWCSAGASNSSDEEVAASRKRSRTDLPDDAAADSQHLERRTSSSVDVLRRANQCGGPFGHTTSPAATMTMDPLPTFSHPLLASTRVPPAPATRWYKPPPVTSGASLPLVCGTSGASFPLVCGASGASFPLTSTGQQLPHPFATSGGAQPTSCVPLDGYGGGSGTRQSAALPSSSDGGGLTHFRMPNGVGEMLQQSREEGSRPTAATHQLCGYGGSNNAAAAAVAAAAAAAAKADVWAYAMGLTPTLPTGSAHLHAMQRLSTMQSGASAGGAADVKKTSTSSSSDRDCGGGDGDMTGLRSRMRNPDFLAGFMECHRLLRPTHFGSSPEPILSGCENPPLFGQPRSIVKDELHTTITNNNRRNFSAGMSPPTTATASNSYSEQRLLESLLAEGLCDPQQAHDVAHILNRCTPSLAAMCRSNSGRQYNSSGATGRQYNGSGSAAAGRQYNDTPPSLPPAASVTEPSRPTTLERQATVSSGQRPAGRQLQQQQHGRQPSTSNDWRPQPLQTQQLMSLLQRLS